MMGRDQGARAWHPAHGSASHRFGLEQTLMTSSSLHLNPHPPSDSLRSSRLFFLFLCNKEKQVIIITSYKWGQAYISFYLSLSGRRKVPLPYAASGAILRGPPRTTTHPRRGSRTARARTGSRSLSPSHSVPHQGSPFRFFSESRRLPETKFRPKFR